jgi:hypothetical protein
MSKSGILSPDKTLKVDATGKFTHGLNRLVNRMFIGPCVIVIVEELTL